MPRAVRMVPPMGFLHVMCRGNNRRELFRYQKDFQVYRLILNKIKNEERVNIFHYCLMPNHVHILVGIDCESNLSLFMKRMNLKYFYYFNRRYGYVGHLWQDRFKSKIVKDKPYFLQCGKYIELNPVRAGIVQSPDDYCHSSYLHYASGLEDMLIDDDPLYLALSSNISKRQLFYRNMIITEEVARTFTYKIKPPS